MNSGSAGECQQSGSWSGIISDTGNYLFLSPIVLQSCHFPSFGKTYMDKCTKGLTEEM